MDYIRHMYINIYEFFHRSYSIVNYMITHLMLIYIKLHIYIYIYAYILAVSHTATTILVTMEALQ